MLSGEPRLDLTAFKGLRIDKIRRGGVCLAMAGGGRSSALRQP